MYLYFYSNIVSIHNPTNFVGRISPWKIFCPDYSWRLKSRRRTQIYAAGQEDINMLSRPSIIHSTTQVQRTCHESSVFTQLEKNLGNRDPTPELEVHHTGDGRMQPRK